MKQQLANKVYLITGATSGIGQATAELAAQQGAKLVLVGRRQARLEQLAQELAQRYQVEVLPVIADLSESVAIEQVVTATMETFGRIDCLISNAGFGDFRSVMENEWQATVAMLQVNVYAMMYLSQLVANQMLTQGSGQILLVGSIAGKVPTPFASAYAASKSALIGYANALRLELYGTGISVTTLNPGPVKTEFFDRNEAMQNYAQQVAAFTLTAEQVAQAIIANNLRKPGPKRELNLPWSLNALTKVYSVFPTIGDYVIVKLFNFKEKNK